MASAVHLFTPPVLTMTTTTATRRSRRTYDGPSPEEKLVASLVELMEQGTAPWRKEWAATTGSHHVNLVSGHRYSGSNVALLALQQIIRGSSLPYWVGRTQAKQQGWRPRKGSKGVYIIRPQMNRYDQTDDKGRPVMGPDGQPLVNAWVSFKPVCIFNAADLEGEGLQEAIDKMANLPQRPQHERIDHAERILTAWQVEAVFQGDRAFYTPDHDRITVPPLPAFVSPESFYATWAHEAIHSTGHKDRLGRDLYNQFGTPGYAREELVAELGAVMLCDRLEIGSNMVNHAAYLGHWATLLKESPKILYRILSEARKAADLICPEDREAVTGAEG